MILIVIHKMYPIVFLRGTCHIHSFLFFMKLLTVHICESYQSLHFFRKKLKKNIIKSRHTSKIIDYKLIALIMFLCRFKILQRYALSIEL